MGVDLTILKAKGFLFPAKHIPTSVSDRGSAQQKTYLLTSGQQFSTRSNKLVAKKTIRTVNMNKVIVAKAR